MIRIAVLGYGTVGSGVVKVIQTNAKIIAKRAGQEVEVKYVLALRDFPDDQLVFDLPATADLRVRISTLTDAAKIGRAHV